MIRIIVLALATALSVAMLLSSAGGFTPDDERPAATVDSLAQARSLLAAAKYAEAEAVLRKSQNEAAPASANYAAIRDLLGVLYTKLGHYGQADECLRDAAAIFEKSPGRLAEYADALTHRAKALELCADYALAEPLIDESFAVLAKGKLERSIGYARALTVLADLKWAQGKNQEARDNYSRAIDIYKAQAKDQSADFAAAQNNLGLLYRSLDLVKADELIRTAMETRKTLVGEGHPDYANSLNSLAAVLQSRGQLSEIEPSLKQALKIRKETLGEIHPDYASTVNALANFYRAQGDYLRAEPEARRAVEICERALGSKHPYYASALNNLALVYRDEANYVDAEPAFKKAISIYDAALDRGHPYGLTVRGNLAELYEAEGDHLRAKRLFDQESEARRKSAANDPRGYALWLAGVARFQRKQRQFEDAKTLLRRALDELKRVPDAELDRAAVLEELANLSLATKDYRSADKQLRDVLDIRSRHLGKEHPDYATALENQASLYQELKFFAAAETRYQTVLALRKDALGAQHPAYATALANLAGARRALGKDAAAAEEYKQALSIIYKHLNATAVSQSEQQQLAMTHTARLYLDEFLSLMIGRSAPVDELYVEVLAWKGVVSRRQQTMREMRRALEEANPEIAGLYQQLETAARRLAQRSHAEPRSGEVASHGLDLDQLSETVERLERELAAKSAEFRRDVESRSRTPADIRQALPAHVALVDLLEYWHFPKVGDSKQSARPTRRLIAFVSRRGRSTESIELGPAKAIEQAVDDWLAGLEQPGKEDAGSRLRQLLWAPLESLVSDAETVLISPDGATAWLPWAALPGKEPGKFLIESQAFVMLPAPHVLPDMLASNAKSTSDSPTLLAVGDIDYGAAPGKAQVSSRKRSAMRGREGDTRFEWRGLAGSRAEIRQVVASFSEAFPDAWKPTSLRGPSPTEEAVRAAAVQHRFLHFATHGFFAPPQVASAARNASSADRAPGERAALSAVAGFHPGLLSGIVLAGANRPEKLDEDDGILTALEIEQLELSDVQLVTLSACQTGIGNTVSGEGLLGLQRAFQVAGAESVLASLWRIDDQQAATLMATFYDNLWLKKLSRAEALRQAQIDLLNDKAQRGMEFFTKRPGGENHRVPPRFWAAFVLSGDWR